MLLLTKPLGAGILTTAAKADLCPADVLEGVYARMATLNKAARDAALPCRVHACTDVTGFGLLGHALELAQGGDVHLTIDTAAADIPAAALEFARMGLLPEGMYRNRRYAEPYVDAGGVPLEVQDALYDPQTSGGLLFAVHPDDADALFAALQKNRPQRAARGDGPDIYGRGAHQPALTARTARRAASASSAVLNQPKDSRTVPRGKVPSVRWAFGAQCSPQRVRMPNSSSSRAAAAALSCPRKSRLNTATRPLRRVRPEERHAGMSRRPARNRAHSARSCAAAASTVTSSR